jgi:hypothetical protein
MEEIKKKTISWIYLQHPNHLCVRNSLYF